jgi:micrococcal nuclease
VGDEWLYTRNIWNAKMEILDHIFRNARKPADNQNEMHQHPLRLFRLLAVVLLIISGLAAGGDTFTGRVVAVVDGDTIKVMHDGRAERIRIYGIDCPELGQPYGTAARKFTSFLAFGKTVTMETRTTDRYGRTISTVLLPEGSDLGKELLHAGFAWWYRKYAPAEILLERLESEAREARKGL